MVKAKSGVDASYEERLEVIRRVMNGESISSIARSMNRSRKFVHKWKDRKDEILQNGHVQSNRKGHVGRKPLYSKEEAAKLSKKLNSLTSDLMIISMSRDMQNRILRVKGTSQIALSLKVGCDVKTLRKHTRFHVTKNPEGSYPLECRLN